jgi:outer membrane PBP1 activator LpoA protein
LPLTVISFAVTYDIFLKTTIPMHLSSVSKLLLVVCLLPLLLACGSTPPVSAPAVAIESREPVASDPAQGQLQMAANAASPEREEYLLNAIELLLLDDRNAEAEDIAARIIDITSLPASSQLRYALLSGEIALRNGAAETALALLMDALSAPGADLDNTLQQRVIELRARAYFEQQRYVDAVRERLLLAALLSPAERALNNDRIWQILSLAPLSELEVRGSAINSYELRGWLELAQVVNANQDGVEQQIQAVAQWRNKWIQHSAAGHLPESLTYVHELWENRAQRIALLIPLEEPAGKAVNEGFLGAWYDALAKGQEVPEIIVYDTSMVTDIMPIYRLAVEQGADMVIGPLRKESVRQLQSLRTMPVPTLALNYGDIDRSSPQGFYQFGLAPEDEIMQAADLAWAAGHRNAALLIPRGEEYVRIRETFVNYWSELGGEVVSEATFSNANPYSQVISELMSIDASEARAAQLRTLLPRSSMNFTPRRRQDIDFIFMLATPLEGRQIKPALAFHFAGDVPVYSMPGIYDGGANPVANRDLNGVIFTDSPWILQHDPLRETLNSVLPASASNVQRLRAMGVDSFRLYARLGQLESFPTARVQGATGTLSMQRNGSIKRELLEARFVNGSAALASSRNDDTASLAVSQRP